MLIATIDSAIKGFGVEPLWSENKRSAKQK